MKKILFIIAVVLVISIAILIALRSKKSEPEFRTENVLRGDIVATVVATGTLNAVTTVLVGTQVSGMVKEIYVDFNSPVKKGQLIALIDPATFEAKVQQAEANLSLAKANLQKAEASLVDAERTYRRNKDLFERNLIAKSEIDTAETNYEKAKADVAASKAEISQRDAILRDAQTNLRYTRILSPVDGVIVSRDVDVGQTVVASFQTPTLFTIAEDLTKMQIDTNVDEADIGRIKIGQDAEFTVDAYPALTFNGKVFQIRISPIIVQNVVTYDVVIRVDNSDLRLKPGMTANVNIIVAKREDVLNIPNSALRARPPLGSRYNKLKIGGRTKEKGDKETTIWVLEKEMLKQIEIKTGISDGNNTEVISGELKEGQEVIVEFLTKPKDNSIPTGGPRFF
ncbi:MAG: efflux RND transporter periplasmic adaptor subunit [Nitrospirota bacterium]